MKRNGVHILNVFMAKLQFTQDTEKYLCVTSFLCTPGARETVYSTSLLEMDSEPRATTSGVQAYITYEL